MERFINHMNWKRIIICFLPSIYYLLPTGVSAQITFERTYGGANSDVGYSVQQTSDEGYIITGYTYSFGAGGADVWLLKTNSSGDTLWTKTYGGSSGEGGFSVQQTSDGRFIIAGGTESFGAGGPDFYLIKTNSSGDALWTRTYGGNNWDDGFSVQQTLDRGFIIAGMTYSFGAGLADVYLIKTDSLGDTLWTRTYGGTGDDAGWSVQQTLDGGFIITGRTGSFGAGSADVWLLKTNSSGDTLWTKTYGGSGGDGGFSVQQTSNGGFIIAGRTDTSGVSLSNVYLINTNSSGDTLWTKTCGGPGRDEGSSVQQTLDGGYVIAGRTTSFGAGSGDVYLIKTDSLGDTLWTRTYGGGFDDWSDAVQQTVDGGYIIVGYTSSFGNGGDVYLIKTDEYGMVVGVDEEEDFGVRISEFNLEQNYPNPFKRETNISYSIPKNVGNNPVRLVVYNISGRLVEVLIDKVQQPGVYQVEWDAKNVPSGIFFYGLKTPFGKTQTRKMVVLK
jgi:hypothetical protein